MTTIQLKPWFSVAIPHEDIRQGRLREAVFAANLWAVSQRNMSDTSEVYLDTEAFFTKTYLTTGLTNVLRKVARAMSGNADASDRILSLQTAFGGGKTHVLVALWHLAKHIDKIRTSNACRELREALGNQLPENINAVAIFTNQTCDSKQGRHTPEGIHTRTLWGELALQLGGVDLYRRIEANDQSRIVPQGLFVDILKQASPCLILLDELADYCVGASAVDVGATTFADQTISFVQQLTEAVNQVKGVAVVATLPASHLEVTGSEKGQEILNALERRFGRMGADIKPVADDEIYEVVRRRLFESVGDPSEHEEVADAYMRMYQQHRSELPNEAARGTYKDRILNAYPFHPALIDALYLRWGSHDDFQRTRGVLRLLASIIGDLWQRRNTETQSQPLIHPCHIRWTIDALHAALTKLWGAAYGSVIAADVIGEKSNAMLLDEERGGDYVTEKIAQGLAATCLLGSFGGQGERAGYSTKDLKLCVGRPDVNWGYTDGALLEMEERAFYLHTASAGNLGKRYWFGTKPRLTKLIVQYRTSLASQKFDEEITESIQRQVNSLRFEPATWRVLVDPEPDLPEQRSLVLLVMPPDCAYSENDAGPNLMPSLVEKRLLELSQKCGTRERIHRNTLLFLLPSSRGLTRLRSAIREVEALEGAKRDYDTQLDSEDRSDLKQRIEAARKNVSESLGAAYTYIARIEGQRVAVSALSDAKSDLSQHLESAWKQVVEEEEWVLRRVGSVTLQRAGLVPTEGGIRVTDAIEAFLRYTDKHMIASRNAVTEGLKKACEEKIIGIGRGLNVNDMQKKWCGEDAPIDLGEEGIWIIPPFEPEPVDTGLDVSADTTTTGASQTITETTTGQTVSGITDTTEVTGRQVRRITIKGDVPAESWSDVFRAFVGPGARMNLKVLKLGINFEMETQDSQPLDESDPVLKAIEEAARQLGLTLEED